MISIKQFGVVGDGITLDTKAIQDAINFSSENGEQVVFEEGIYLTGTIVLKSNTNINIRKGAVILGSSDFEDYKSDIKPFVDAVNQERGRCLLYADGVENVKICGEGTINGRGEMFGEDHPEHLRRPFLCRFVGSKNIEICDVNVRNSAAWCMHFLDCENVDLKNVTIISRVNENNDGIDIDSCRNFQIKGCLIDTKDDGICLKTTVNKSCSNVSVKDCIISSRWGALKIGTESYGDFKDILFENCKIYDTEGCGIKIVPVDGGNLEGLVINNISMTNCTGPIFIGLGERLRTYFFGDKPREIGSIKNVSISGITADVIDAEGFHWNPGNAKGFVTRNGLWGNGKGCVVISGIPSRRIENVVLKDMDLVMPGGGTEEGANNAEIMEMGRNYPEFHIFGTLPSYGLFLRHIDGIKIKNVKLKLKKQDYREAVYLEDVENLSMEQ